MLLIEYLWYNVTQKNDNLSLQLIFKIDNNIKIQEIIFTVTYLETGIHYVLYIFSGKSFAPVSYKEISTEIN